jgi:hypothetical protein
VWSGGGVKREKRKRQSTRAIEIYDRWAPHFSLTPVKPMTRFRTPVDCIGAVFPRLQQKYI